MSTRVLLADDHLAFLDGLRAFLEKQADIEIVDVAHNGIEAVNGALDKRPHVVVMDVSMPGMNGIEATHRITTQLPGVKVIGLSMHSERSFLAAFLEAGASGYLLKEHSLEELVRAINTVQQDMTYLSPSIAGTVVDDYLAVRAGSPHSVFGVLTAREREVLQLLVEGHSTKEVARLLGLSVKTISTHREHIMEKLDIHSIAGLTKYAIREGLTSQFS